MDVRLVKPTVRTTDTGPYPIVTQCVCCRGSVSFQ